jgi:hypothetical protein
MPDMQRPTASTSALIAAQASVATREQLQGLTLTEDQIRAQLHAGRWRALNDTVICLHNGPLTSLQSRWAGVLSAPAPAALCGLTALEGCGVTGFATSSVHVVIARGARMLLPKGVDLTVHESRRFTVADIDERSMPPATSLERAAIDAAAWSRDVITASRIAVAPIQQRRTTARRLLDELDAAGKVRHHRLLRSLLFDLDGGAEGIVGGQLPALVSAPRISPTGAPGAL